MSREFSYENQGANTYLKYTFSQDMIPDSMAIGMLTNNTIEGFLSAVFVQMDNVKSIKYNVTSKINIHQFFGGKNQQNKDIKRYERYFESVSFSRRLYDRSKLYSA